jgi:hypothetical protein
VSSSRTRPLSITSILRMQDYGGSLLEVFIVAALAPRRHGSRQVFVNCHRHHAAERRARQTGDGLSWWYRVCAYIGQARDSPTCALRSLSASVGGTAPLRLPVASQGCAVSLFTLRQALPRHLPLLGPREARSRVDCRRSSPPIRPNACRNVPPVRFLLFLEPARHNWLYVSVGMSVRNKHTLYSLRERW